MLGFGEIGKNDLTVKNILSRVSEITLWRYYIGVDFVLGKPFKAQYRVDNNPSFNVFRTHSGHIYGKDWGRDFTGDIFSYLKYVYRINFNDALMKINSDFNLGLGTGIIVNIPNAIIDIKTIPIKGTKISNKQFTIFKRTATELDINYWLQYGITRDTLNKYHVWPIDVLMIDGADVYKHSDTNPGYAYHFPRSNHIKCYFPLHKDKSRRFIGNISNETDIQGYDQCNVKGEGELLVLTKSMKDCMLLHEYEIDAMAIHGETQRFNPDFIRHIKKYYRRIISLYDRDITGMRGAKYLWKEYQIEPYFIPKSLGSKDISDLFRDRGISVTTSFVQGITQ